MKQHVRVLFQADTDATPWPRMILCGLATGIPLLIGVYQGQLTYSIYGAIGGYLLALNDHLGSIRHRLKVINFTMLLLVGGFALGYVFKGASVPYCVLLTAMMYWLGVLSGEGAELERAALFGTLAMIIANSSPAVPSPTLKLFIIYVGISYICLMIGIPFLEQIKKRKPDPFKTMRESLQKSFTLESRRHTYAVAYTFVALASIWLTQAFQLERGYWVTVTVLLVMRPDRKKSFYTTLQRLIGTLAAALLCDLAIQIVHETVPLIALVVVCAFAVPWAAKRNYVLVAFFATVMVVFLLELATADRSDMHIPLLRLQATIIGCGLSVIGSVFSKTLDWTVLQLRRATAVKN